MYENGCCGGAATLAGYSDPWGGDGGDGFDPGEAGDWFRLGKDVWGLWQKYGPSDEGGPTDPWGYNNNGTDPCPGTPSWDAIHRAVQRAPAARISQIIEWLHRANGIGPNSRADLLRKSTLPNWVKAMYGGRNCKIDRSEYNDGPELVRSLTSEFGHPGPDVDPDVGAPLGERVQGIPPVLLYGLPAFFILRKVF